MSNAVNRQASHSAATSARVCDASASGCSLVWQGDDIGLAIDSDVIVTLRDPAMPGGVWHVSLADALDVFDRLDSYGRERMESALRFSAEHGYLSASDMAAWEDYVAHGAVRWVPVVHVKRDGGEQTYTGEPLLGHRAALNAAESMCDSLGGEWSGVRRMSECGAV
ncbi:hypothetical protein [Burkholderia pseudomallei]|uniref:hypothetical protein n=1 Tax=Burkholderia pseudomallei TaxID=28450 RepID=UPI0005DCA490|nr:hypothetical protein [Burkholderia pseudomallei]MCE2031928.1 hypothetical protein [Burkholderia pseudomallei CS]MCE2038176.1 hypothetical protein [Burkholderia pseudomallei CB]MCE2044061.1 hypothetical protein [Burkholderia pseudomallei OS]MCE2050186.1 hypothetical protein [Burkholderia pseudomallei OB]OAG63936.1 hypothetical protein BIM11_4641 [Burkholderia pseudomallei]